MAVITTRRYGNLAIVCILACILIPALTLYGRPSFEYSKQVGSHVLGAVSTHIDKWKQRPGSKDSNIRDEYLAICLAVRDQHLDLPEFLQHHYYAMGIRRFYLLDDGSTPPLQTSLNTYGVPTDALTFVYYNESQRVGAMQYHVYNECAQVYGVNHTWLAFIDADEFLDTPGGESLESILKAFEKDDKIGALGVNWQMHTSNGQLHRADSVRTTYTQCIYDDPDHNGDGSDNRHVKSIVRARDYSRPVNPHMFYLAEGKITVGEDGQHVDHYAFRQPITRDRVSLHHYAVKSKEEYEEKIHRSNAMDQPKGEEFWNHVEHDLPHVACEDMLRWVDPKILESLSHLKID